MLLSSFSFSVEYAQALRFEDYLKNIVIKKIKNEGGIHDLKLLKLLTELDNGATTLSLQLYFKDMEHFMEFELNHRESLLFELQTYFKGSFVYFHTLLEEC